MAYDFQQLAWNPQIEDDLRRVVRLAVREDLDRYHDWTTVALVEPDVQGRALLVARQPGIVAGLRAVPAVIDEMHAAIEFTAHLEDGDRVAGNTVLAELNGRARDMLTCERPLLNLLGRLSGIATLTGEFVERVQGTNAKVYDTRKTIPAWRRLEKYAVQCGGGRNHRTGLFDAILIKDNHLALAADSGLSPADAVRRARKFVESLAETTGVSQILVEVEIDRLDQLDEVLQAGPDIVLLDNLGVEELRMAVSRRNELGSSIELEASGGVSLATVRDIALTGIDRISCGALTHTVRWLDVALDWSGSADRL